MLASELKSWIVSALGAGPLPKLPVTATVTAQCLPAEAGTQKISLDRRIQSKLLPRMSAAKGFWWN